MVSVFLSVELICSLPYGSSPHPRGNPRSRRANTAFTFIKSHTDQVSLVWLDDEPNCTLQLAYCSSDAFVFEALTLCASAIGRCVPLGARWGYTNWVTASRPFREARCQRIALGIPTFALGRWADSPESMRLRGWMQTGRHCRLRLGWSRLSHGHTDEDSRMETPKRNAPVNRRERSPFPPFGIVMPTLVPPALCPLQKLIPAH